MTSTPFTLSKPYHQRNGRWAQAFVNPRTTRKSHELAGFFEDNGSEIRGTTWNEDGRWLKEGSPHDLVNYEPEREVWVGVKEVGGEMISWANRDGESVDLWLSNPVVVGRPVALKRVTYKDGEGL